MEIHSDVMKDLFKWNRGPERDDRDLDYAFGLSVYLSFVPVQNIEAGCEIDQNALVFVLGNFSSLQIIS